VGINNKKNSLANKNPKLSKQWHPTKNGLLTPINVTVGSDKKVWWRCEKGHEWEATISHRVNGTGCPYCSGRYACADNCLQTLNPKLSKQWHPTKNGKLTPNDVTTGSRKKVWWQCEKGHEWEAIIAYKTGCPYCSGQRVCDDNSLQILNPELSKQWHLTKNGNLTPNDVTLGSPKKVWWQCDKGHEWEADIYGRNKGNGCPYCSGRYACADNCLQTLNPKLSKQWHLIKNGDLTPNDVTLGSDKKVWWQCEKGHEWEERIYNRIRGHGCPYCSGQRVCDDNSLQTLNPELSKQWHPTKNGDLTPNGVTAGSPKKIWWQCEKGHEWEAAVHTRNSGFGCPYCSGRYVCADNCLQALNPELSKQWHPTKNGDLTPNDVTTGSKKKVWWRCREGHEWEAVIYSRNSGTGCPVCSLSIQTSFPEQSLYFYLKSIFLDASNRYRHDSKWEIDVFVPSLNFGIEYDGIYYHHKEKKTTDTKKEKYLMNEGICLLRVKETRKKLIKCCLKKNIIYCNEDPSVNQLNEIIEACFKYISKNITHKYYTVDVDVKRDRAKIYDLYIKGEEAESFYSKYPELSYEWHPTKNLNLKPNMVRPGSEKKVWWQCDKGHEWESTIYNRTTGSSCPYCSGKRACMDNCLQTLNPELSKQWHRTKNGDLTPYDVTIYSNKKVWWQCEKGHEWKAIIGNRTKGIGCPYCSGRYASVNNSLQVLNPELSKQWHRTKNGNLTPSDVTRGSDRKVWWQCDKGHEYEASINDRSNGRGCPYCSGKRKTEK